VDYALDFLVILWHSLHKYLQDLTSSVCHHFLKLDLRSIAKQDRLTWHNSKESFLDLRREVVPIHVDGTSDFEGLDSLRFVGWEDMLLNLFFSDSIIVDDLNFNRVKNGESSRSRRIELFSCVELQLLVRCDILIASSSDTNLCTELVDH